MRSRYIINIPYDWTYFRSNGEDREIKRIIDKLKIELGRAAVNGEFVVRTTFVMKLIIKSRQEPATLAQINTSFLSFINSRHAFLNMLSDNGFKGLMEKYLPKQMCLFVDCANNVPYFDRFLIHEETLQK